MREYIRSKTSSISPAELESLKSELVNLQEWETDPKHRDLIKTVSRVVLPPPPWLPLWLPLWLTLPIHATASRCRAWRSALWGPLWTCLRGGGCARGRTRCSSCTACGAILARYLWLPPYGSPLGSSIAG